MAHFKKRKYKYKPMQGDYTFHRPLKIVYGYPTREQRYNPYSPGKLVMWADVV